VVFGRVKGLAAVEVELLLRGWFPPDGSDVVFGSVGELSLRSAVVEPVAVDRDHGRRLDGTRGSRRGRISQRSITSIPQFARCCESQELAIGGVFKSRGRQANKQLGVKMTRIKCFFAAGVAVLAVASPALADPSGSSGTPPPADPQGCHGAATVAYKQATGDPQQGAAIRAQAHSDAGRGATLQAFLAAECGVGSLAP
jgi:hypothetical protein